MVKNLSRCGPGELFALYNVKNSLKYQFKDDFQAQIEQSTIS